MSLSRPRRRLLDEIRDGGDRHRNVVLDRAALRFLHLGEHVADVPERLGLLEAVGDGRVLDQSLRAAVREQLLHAVAQAVARAATTLPSARTRGALSPSGSRTPWHA